MASRISFYCAVFLGMLLYDTTEALNCYTQISCSGTGCSGRENTDPVLTECREGFDVCFKASSKVTVNGYKADYTALGCSISFGTGNGCSSFDELPAYISELYESWGLDSFKYCLCDQDLCYTGSITDTSTIPVMIGSSGVNVYTPGPSYIVICGASLSLILSVC